jgi:hypothetical protein
MRGGCWLFTTLWLAIGCWLFCGCKEEAAPVVSPAFYHWQTHLQLTENERLHLDSLGVKKLYVKFFDVDWDEASSQPVPHAQVEIDTARLAGLEIVPTVFITNRTFLNLKMAEVPGLAERIFDKMEELAKPLTQPLTPKGEPDGEDFRIDEIQFDCDWTEQTREKFFALLEHFKMKMRSSSLIPHPSSLSATIRLHQLRFFEKTGVPPVDRGMLMFYNMGDLEAWETENSILDPETASRYLRSPQSSVLSPQSLYPLPLDVALPLFRWGVLFRDGRLIKLINNLGVEDLMDTERFNKIAPHRYEVKKSTYLQGYYLYEGDRLRLEAVDSEQLEAAAAMLRFVKSGTATVAFYHLDTTTIKLFSHEKLEKVLDEFH